MVSEFVKDDVLIPKEIDKSTSQEEQLRTKFAVAKLIKTWNDTRIEYLSSKGGTEDQKLKLDYTKEQLTEKFGATFGTNYVEIEYGAKLIPDGKRCRMDKPFHKNILFIGDAAGRGVFIGPKIEGLNVGIDDAVRAATSIANALDRNDFGSSLGQHYTQSINESPYTTEMKEIDKDYLAIFLNAAKDVPKDLIGQRYGPIMKMMSSGTFRGIAVKFANILGYEKLLPMIESEDTYVKVPMQLAERLGKSAPASYSIQTPTIAERIERLKYNDDHQSHIKILENNSEYMRKMITLCPAKCYSGDTEKIILQHEGCIDCGTCSLKTEWKHPRGEKGIHYQFG